MANDLIIELPKANALQVFTEPKGIDPYIEKIRAEALSLVPDITTKKGRDEIASMAHSVARSKTYLLGAAKELRDNERKKIDSTLSALMTSSKTVESELDAIRDEVRKPLTDWENAESERKNRIQSRIESIKTLPQIGSNSEAIAKHLRRLEKTEIDESFGEFTAEAAIERTRAIRDCKAKLEAQIKIEDDQKELEVLRQHQAEQAAKDREQEIINKTANDVRIAAENVASAKIMAAQSELEKERAAIRETERLEEVRIAEENKRKADKEYRLKIIAEAAQSFEDLSVDCEDSFEVIQAIIDGKIKHVTLNF